MEILIMLAVGALVIALGMRLVHRHDARHDARIAAYHFGDPFPSIRPPPGRSRPRPAGRTAGLPPTGTRP
ncbi:hypothetical protein [Streptomyces sp. NPDC059176]|uniref:hypothetical protein n=1 Tax=unclassified Streptomyces TaxID=2593676 RepID=UPI0036C24013